MPRSSLTDLVELGTLLLHLTFKLKKSILSPGIWLDLNFVRTSLFPPIRFSYDDFTLFCSRISHKVKSPVETDLMTAHTFLATKKVFKQKVLNVSVDLVAWARTAARVQQFTINKFEASGRTMNVSIQMLIDSRRSSCFKTISSARKVDRDIHSKRFRMRSMPMHSESKLNIIYDAEPTIKMINQRNRNKRSD